MADMFTNNLEVALHEIVQKVRIAQEEEKLQGKKNLYEIESNVEHQLIGPLLNALQWDIANPMFVTTKYWEQSSDKPDFVLHLHGSPAVVIEAKALGKIGGVENLDQIYRYLRYCPHVILTDGIEWKFYHGSSRSYLESNIEYEDEAFQYLKPLWTFNLFKHNMKYCLILLSSIKWVTSLVSLSESVGSSYEEARSMQSKIFNSSLRNAFSQIDVYDLVKDTVVPLIQKYSIERYGHELSRDNLDFELEYDYGSTLMKLIHRNIRDREHEDED